MPTKSVPKLAVDPRTVNDNVTEQGIDAQQWSLVSSYDPIYYESPDLKSMGSSHYQDSSRADQPSTSPHIDVSALGIPEESATSLESLQAYILDLQRKAKALEEKNLSQEPSRYQTVHRISQGKSSLMYFDRPQWIIGENNTKALRSNLPLSSISSYLDKHPELAFIVYRNYDSVMKEAKPSDDEDDIMPEVKHASETLEPTTKDLTNAISAFLEWKKDCSDVSDNFEDSRELTAPYLIIYHSRNIIEEYRAVDSLLKRRKITYPYIKYLFKPDDVLVEGKDQNVRGFLSKSWLDAADSFFSERRKSSKKGSRKQRWNIYVWSWGFNGAFSRQNCTLALEIDSNDLSEKDIDELNLRPLAYTTDEVACTLRQRGETFWKCRIRHFVSYHEEAGREFHHSGDERYMIDLKMYRELHEPERNKASLTEEVFKDDLGAEAIEEDKPPDDKFVYLLPLTIKGYSLKRKKWLDLKVDRIAEVVWNKEAFESLVLDRKTKRLIQALISNQLEAEKSTDLISGKGNGLILLLHGGPETGKTLTAESVAEMAEKPLYPVTCGDIGTEPEEVESYLESVLTLGKTWNCVVLLDEADVFLEQRSLEDLRRNALVSVFLRVLEYYDGILVLTSNRVGTFDEAFKSRIQLALHYANLGPFQRTQIWLNFIMRLEKLGEENVDFDDLRDHVEVLAENKMNGRQIRNAITTARQYAKWEDKPLNYLLLKDIIDIAGRFDVYIEKLNGGYSQDQLAEEEGLRLSKAP
jgi:hypothetical protein